VYAQTQQFAADGAAGNMHRRSAEAGGGSRTIEDGSVFFPEEKWRCVV
jgi:hypothetical protein